MTLYRVGVADSDAEFTERLEFQDALKVHIPLPARPRDAC